MMTAVHGKRAAFKSGALFERDSDLAHLQFTERRAVLIVQSTRLLEDGLGVFVDCVAAVRGMHPAVVRIEPLIDEELSPRYRAIGVQSLLAGHLQFRTEIVRGVRIYPEKRVSR